MILNILFWYFLASSVSVLFLVAIPIFFMNLYFYRAAPGKGGAHPFHEVTMIKPLRGKDAHLRENLQSFVDFKPKGKYQLLLAMESNSDPAYEAALEFQRNNPSEDIEIVLTGPSQDRMGKIHNMIEAVKKAKYSIVAFSDSDVRLDSQTYSRTLETLFKADACFLPPLYEAPKQLGSCIVAGYTNYFYFQTLAPAQMLGALNFFGGGFMMFRRVVLEEVGGLAPFAHHIADDYALGRALSKRGKKIRLVPHILRIPSEPESLKNAFKHIRRWSIIIRSCLTAPYIFIPVAFLPLNALGLLILGLALQKMEGLCVSLFFLAYFFRIASCFVQDVLLSKVLPPVWMYLLLVGLDLASPLWWGLSFLSNRIEWRGKHYKVRTGGEVVVV
ncbi:MAG: glycosyltransferase [Elusimicrobia bacterium]|nr:glycosyltransferase [Elusimicrobiota bacterium]